MAANFGSSFGGNVGGIIGGVTQVGFWGLIVVLAVTGMFFITRWNKNRKSFNIPVTIFIPRSDNTTSDIIRAVGGYFKSKPVGGITSFRLKRKGLGVIELPPPQSRYLMGFNRELFLVQKGMDDFEPILPKSFSYVKEEGTDREVAVINLKAVNQDATAWKFDNETNAKQRFTFHSFWEKYKDFIQITIFIFIVFISAYIQWNGLKEVAESLEQVAKLLGPQVQNIPIVSSLLTLLI